MTVPDTTSGNPTAQGGPAYEKVLRHGVFSFRLALCALANGWRQSPPFKDRRASVLLRMPIRICWQAPSRSAASRDGVRRNEANWQARRGAGRVVAHAASGQRHPLGRRRVQQQPAAQDAPLRPGYVPVSNAPEFSLSFETDNIVYGRTNIRRWLPAVSAREEWKAAERRCHARNGAHLGRAALGLTPTQDAVSQVTQ